MTKATIDYRDETLYYLGECFRDLSEQVSCLPIAEGLSPEQASEREIELINSGIKAFQIATGIIASPAYDTPAVSALLATNSQLRRMLVKLILEAASPGSVSEEQGAVAKKRSREGCAL